MQISNTQTPSSAWSRLMLRLSMAAIVLGLFMVPLSITLTNIFIIIAAACSLCCFNKDHYKALLKHPITLWALALFVLVLLGTLWSYVDVAAQIKAIQKYSKLIILVLLLPVLSDKRMLKLALHAFLVGVLITVVISYCRWFGWLHSDQSPDAVVHNHIIMSFLVAFAAYITLYYAYQHRAYRWLYISLFILLTFQMFFINQGRTGYIIYLALLLLFGMQYFRWKGMLFALIGCGLLFAAGLHMSPRLAEAVNISVTSLKSYSKDTPAAQETSWGYRLSFAKVSFEFIKQKPWLGFGTGSFSSEFAKTGGLPGWGIKLDTPHNEYLLFAVQFGLLGLVLFIVFFIRLYLLAFKFKGVNAKPAQALLIAATVGNFCDALFYTSTIGFFFIAMVGVLFANMWLSAKEEH